LAAPDDETRSAGYATVAVAFFSLCFGAALLVGAGGRAASNQDWSNETGPNGRSSPSEPSLRGVAGNETGDGSGVEALFAGQPLVVDARLADQPPGPRVDRIAAGGRRRIIINGVGDVNVDPGYIPALAAEGYQHALSGMGGLFLEDDLTVINLECPASSRGQPVPKQFNFRCDPAALPILRADGVEVANQGNNHILDFGVEAMLDSLANLEATGIAPVGAGVDAAAAHRPALFSIGGWDVAVVGFGGVVPSADWIASDDRPGMADGDTIETMTAAVRAADEVADLVVVTIHWGVELQTGPPPDDVARAEAMVEAGADVIFGHHAHRLNSLELVGGRPVAWSLGNFVWPRLSAAGSDTAVAQVIVEPDGTIISCLLDVTIVSGGHPELDDPTIRTCFDLPGAQ
jgi:poly-gamma-glutamate synthesis protein (capsule biosynthesis protein)